MFCVYAESSVDDLCYKMNFLLLIFLFNFLSATPLNSEVEKIDENEFLQSDNQGYWRKSALSVQNYFGKLDELLKKFYENTKIQYREVSNQVEVSYNATLSLFLDLKSDLKEKLDSRKVLTKSSF